MPAKPDRCQIASAARQSGHGALVPASGFGFVSGLLIALRRSDFRMTASWNRSTTKDRPMIQHASDCAVHNAPALPVGPCDCGADIRASMPREPTTAMEAAVLKELEWIKNDNQRKAHLEEYKRRWRAMFDAALGS